MELLSDGVEADAVRYKLLDLFIALASSLTPLLLELVCLCWWRSRGRGTFT
jgi:hypothetical protein